MLTYSLIRRDTLKIYNQPLNKLLSLTICSFFANTIFVMYKGVFELLGYIIYLPITFLTMVIVGLPISLLLDWLLLKRTHFIRKSLLLHSMIYFSFILVPTGNLNVIMEWNRYSLFYFLLFSFIPVLFWTINYSISRLGMRKGR